MSRQKYQYDHLTSGSQQIRLVTIRPKHKSKVLHLEITQASLENIDGQYEAISYMWGPKTSPRHIMVNGKLLQIGDNIWRCLRHLRDNQVTKSRLWIDAICINQADDNEKNQQVAAMREIFEHASRVLIWLGSTSMRTYLDSSGESIDQLPPRDHDTWIDVLGHSDARSWSLENQIMSIAYNPYWYRLWIIQETALARHICIIFGDSLLSEDFMEPIYHAAREDSKPGYRSWIVRQKDPSFEQIGTALLDHHPMLTALYHTSMSKDPELREGFGDLIVKFQWQFCSNFRDYLYGLLGLLDPALKVEVDYGLTNEEVAIQALQLLHWEDLHSSRPHVGVNLQAAAALFKVLTVTSQSFSNALQTLPVERASTLHEPISRIHLWPMKALTASEGGTETETEYDEVYRLPVSGRLTKDIYRMKPSRQIMIKLLNGHVKSLTSRTALHSQGDPEGSSLKSGVSLLCFLGLSPLILRMPSCDGGKVEIEHFLQEDNEPAHKSAPFIEQYIPDTLRESLQREINAPGDIWNDLHPKSSRKVLLQLSPQELVSLGEVIAQQRSDVAEFWENSARP